MKIAVNRQGNNLFINVITKEVATFNGGEGSGNWGHTSITREGKVGGSDSEKNNRKEPETKKNGFSEFNKSYQKKFLKAKEKLQQTTKLLRENEYKDKQNIRNIIDNVITPLFKELNKKIKEEVFDKETMQKQQEYFKNVYDIILKIGSFTKKIRENIDVVSQGDYGIKEPQAKEITEKLNNVLKDNNYNENNILELNKIINDWHKATYIDFVSKDDKLDFNKITEKYYSKEAIEQFKIKEKEIQQKLNKELNNLYKTDNIDYINNDYMDELKKIYKGKLRNLKELNKQAEEIRKEAEQEISKYSPYSTIKQKEYIKEIENYLKEKGYKGTKVHSSFPKSLSEYWIIYNPKIKDLKMLRFSDHYDFINKMENFYSVPKKEQENIYKKIKQGKMYKYMYGDIFKEKHWGDKLPKNYNYIDWVDNNNKETYKGFAFWDINENNLKKIYDYNNY